MAGHATSAGRFGFLSNHYVKVYIVLLVLLAVSIVGPTMGILFVTLVTAFGVAAIKAWLVIKHFMHLTIERVVPKLFLAASVLLLALFWGGVAPDVQRHEGRMWVNDAARAAVERGVSEEGPAEEEEEHVAEGDPVTEGERVAEGEHAAEGELAAGSPDVGVSYAGLVPSSKSIDSALPGGYNFAHAAFWTVLAMVAIGTNAVAIILSIGLLLLAIETLSKIPMLQRIMGPLLERILRLPGMGRIRRFLPGGQEA